MSVIVEHDGERWLYCKGAPEVVLQLCTQIDQAGGEAPLDVASRQQVGEAQEAMADRGLRVLAFAWRKLAAHDLPLEQGLTFSGLLGLHDPPRPEGARGYFALPHGGHQGHHGDWRSPAYRTRDRPRNRAGAR
jgi:sodium/potassium-transporting ATPase subunit alpha